MVEGEVLDRGLKAYPLRDMPELPSGRRTATQDHHTTLGQFRSSQAAEAASPQRCFKVPTIHATLPAEIKRVRRRTHNAGSIEHRTQHV